MNETSTMTKSEAIQAVLNELDGPIEWDEFARRVLALAPSKAKKPDQGIRTGLRYDCARNVIFLDKKKLIPTRVVMKRLCFRITLTRQEAEHGAVAITPWFIPFFQTNFLCSDQGEFEPHFYDEQEQAITWRPATLRQQIDNTWGSRESVQVAAIDLSGWLAKHNVRRGDSLLVTIKDWIRQEYILAFESAKSINKTKVQQQNTGLGNAIYDVVCGHSDDRPYSTEIIPYAYARLGDAAYDYPGDHWTRVVDDDKRLGRMDYLYVGLARYLSFDDEPLLQEADPASLDKVFRFKASFKYRKSLWRRIELRGSDTLNDFDNMMRDAFDHDWDHLSEFYYKPKDRKGRNVGWEGYGYHGGFDEDRGTDDIQLAELDLEVGDQLRYVYDFGDNIQHIIELEEIIDAEPDADYPRIAERNKPRYRNCVSCAEKGKKTRATMICIECSNEEQREVLLCDECASKDHEDHYVDEIIY
ncbi:MAG: hypothetical protein JXB30_13350 [Anaerolineae bacterium]|nr:hypothetical protein [Anaerolineae bacterium]